MVTGILKASVTCEKCIEANTGVVDFQGSINFAASIQIVVLVITCSFCGLNYVDFVEFVSICVSHFINALRLQFVINICFIRTTTEISKKEKKNLVIKMNHSIPMLNYAQVKMYTNKDTHYFY